MTHSLRTLEELTLTTSSIASILPKRIADFVEQSAREERYGRQLLRANTTLLKSQGRSVHLPLRGSITVDRLSEAATPSEQDVAWSTTEVTPFKLGCYFHVTQEAIDGSDIDVVNGSIQEAGEGLADREDDEIFSEFLGRLPDPVVSAGIWTWTAQSDAFTGDGSTLKFTLSYNPVVEMSTVTDGGSATTAYAVDYYDGEVEFDVAPVSGNAIVIDYWYTDRTNTRDATTVADFKIDDLVAANIFFRTKKARGDVVVINPDQLSSILKDSTFIDTSAYGSREVILLGEVGKISGFKVLTTTSMPAGTALFLNTKRAGWHVLKRNIDVKRKDSPDTDSYKFYVYFEFAPKVTDEDAVYVSVNHNVTYAETIA